MSYCKDLVLLQYVTCTSGHNIKSTIQGFNCTRSNYDVLSGRGARRGHQNFMNSCGVKVGNAALLITIVFCFQKLLGRLFDQRIGQSEFFVVNN